MPYATISWLDDHQLEITLAAARKKRRKNTKRPQEYDSSAKTAPLVPQGDGEARTNEAKSGSRRELITNVGVAAGSALLSWGLTWFAGPWQEVRAEEAVREAEEAKARAKGPLVCSAAYRWEPDDPFGWAFPGGLSSDSVRRLRADGDAYAPGEWAQSAGGVRFAIDPEEGAFGFSRVRLTLRGQSIKPVQVTELRAKVTRSEPLAGALLWAGAQGGSPIIDIGFDLDAEEVVARTRTDEYTLGKYWTSDNQLTVARDEIVTLDIVAQTRRHFCEWDIRLDLKVEEATQQVIVKDGDRPFLTTAPAPRYAERYTCDLDPSIGWKAAGPGELP
jgi:hypothetical protein